MHKSLALLVGCLLGLITLTARPVHAETTNNSQGETTMEHVIITRKSSVAAVKGAETTFTGEVSVEFLVPRRGESRLSGGLVRFSPGARTHWHTHPYGQLLLVQEGRGRVQEQGGEIQNVAPGDLVWFPAGVKHWHGAAPDEGMTHYAIQEELSGSAVEWMEKVTDEQYGR